MKESKLELKHLAPYLPSQLFVWYEKGDSENEQQLNLEGVNTEEVCILIEEVAIRKWVSYDEIKPILHPLSDLTKEIEHNGEKFVPFEELFDNDNNIDGDCYYWETLRLLSIGGGFCGQLPLWLTEKLFEWKFDVFGLIDQGLAIEISSPV